MRRLHLFEPSPAGTRLLQHVDQEVEGNVRGQRQSGHAEEVGDVVPSEQRGRQFDGARGRVQLEAGPLGVEDDRVGPDVRRPFQAIRDRTQAGLRGECDQATAIGIVAVDDGRGAGAGGGQLLEETPLGQEISVEIVMVVEVVACQIGEGGGREAHPADAMLVERVRRDLHHGRRAPVVPHGGQEALEFTTVGRRAAGRDDALAIGIFDGGDQPGFAAGRLEHVAEQAGDGGLAVGARDAIHGQGLRRIALDRAGHAGQGGPRMDDLDPPRTGRRRRKFRRDGHDAAGQRLFDMAEPLVAGTADGDEKIAGPRLAGVAADAGHLEGVWRRARHDIHRLQQINHFHAASPQSSSSATAGASAAASGGGAVGSSR